ncbi:MAG: glutamine-hydrolyzing GMP synthase [Candidatus Peregrinibacteria bacterium]
MEVHHPIIVLDFGGQYAHLIARRIRSFGVMAEIRDPAVSAEELKNAAEIILSGGPQSVYEEGSPQADPKIFELGIPVLGICYGLHWMTQTLKGTVTPGKVKEYGQTMIKTVDGGGKLLRDFDPETSVWMSHGDEASVLPPGFKLTATSAACNHVAFEDSARNFFAVQFHPEVVHTEHGFDLLKRFSALCKATPWSLTGYVQRIAGDIKAQVGDRKVFMLVSGGVDSTVAFTLLNQVLGTERVQGFLVDTGLMRKGEITEIREAFDQLNVHNLKIEDASEEFFRNLQGVYEPEAKRKIIGDTFLAVQARVSEGLGLTADKGWMLGQGTIYPDTIETKGTKHADHIKTHHNRVAAVQELIVKGLVIEPLKELYKDEVRVLGEELGLPHQLVWRHPFPGPGLGVRILCSEQEKFVGQEYSCPTNFSGSSVLPVQSVGVQGDGRTYRHALAVFQKNPFIVSDDLKKLSVEIPNTSREINRVLLCTSHTAPTEFVFTPGYLTQQRADLLREADAIVAEEMRAADLYEIIWQFPVVLLPFGTKPDGQSIVLRPVESEEAMTARAAPIPEAVLKRMTERILKLSGIDCVFYDLTSKPPGTIEWE